MKSRMFIGAIALLLCSTAFATGKPKDPPKPDSVPTPVATSNSNAAAGAIAGAAAVSNSASTSNASSASLSNATGGNATAAGGDAASYAQGGRGGNGYGAADAAAAAGDSYASADGTQNTNVDASQLTVYERQVPALIMGTVIPVDCGFGGQAGAANTNGAGFLGASWTTQTCYALKVANAFAAIGEYGMACELWVGITQKMLRKRRNIVNVDCNTIVARLHAMRAPASQPVVTAPATPAPNYVTREELLEYMDRAFKKSVSK